jgi:hypothetical protein
VFADHLSLSKSGVATGESIGIRCVAHEATWGASAFTPRRIRRESPDTPEGGHAPTPNAHWMEAEDLLRHRVRGIIAAAEGRAEQLLGDAERDAVEARREAALDTLDAVAEVEQALRLALRRLSATAARLATSLDVRPEDCEQPLRQPPPRQRDGDASRRPGRFIRASMRERPVAALFAAAAERDADEAGGVEPWPLSRGSS